MSRGRPFERGNKFGHGRPKGSPNKKTLKGEQIFEQNSPAIMALAINRSREDPQMLRMLASRVVARQQSSCVKIGRLPMNTFYDLDRASAYILEKATSGKLRLGEAREFFYMIDMRRRILMAQELDRRLSLLENGGGASLNQGSDTGKKFDGTMEDLLKMYRQMVIKPEEEKRLCAGIRREAHFKPLSEERRILS